MSELKAILATPHPKMKNACDGAIEVYPKSEADKVIAEKDTAISELKEAQRWRKFPDEKPSAEGYYIICGSSGFRNADKWTYCKDRQKMDFSFFSYGVKYWMPFLSAPEENK